MAQANVDTTSLRRAILSIQLYARGCRRFSEQITKHPSIAPYFRLSEPVRKFANIVAKPNDELVYKRASEFFDTLPPFQLDDVLLSGSVSEGMFHYFSPSDTDLMCVLKNIHVSEADQESGNLEMREDSPFVNLYLIDSVLIKTWEDFVEKASERPNRLMLSSTKLKLRLKENYEKGGEIFLAEEVAGKIDDGPAFPLGSKWPGNEKMRSFFAEKIKKFELLKSRLVKDMTEDVIISHEDMLKDLRECPKVSEFPETSTLSIEEGFDIVLAIKCEGWPSCAMEWMSRPRCWPTQELVHRIANENFHIVCKRSSEGNFRLSFSNAEMLLIENLSKLQYKVYRAFKAVVNHFKEEWDVSIKDIFCSYHLKTIVLWYCETSRPEEWCEDTVVPHLLALIDQLISALREKKLPMYFMPKYNLLRSAQDGKLVAEKLEMLRWNISAMTTCISKREPDFELHASSNLENILWSPSTVKSKEWKIENVLLQLNTEPKDIKYCKKRFKETFEFIEKYFQAITFEESLTLEDLEDVDGINEIVEGITKFLEGSLGELCDQSNQGLPLLRKLQEALKIQLDEGRPLLERKKAILEIYKDAFSDEAACEKLAYTVGPFDAFEKLKEYCDDLIKGIPSLEAEIKELSNQESDTTEEKSS